MTQGDDAMQQDIDAIEQAVQTFFIAARLAQLELGITVIDEFTARAFAAPEERYPPLSAAEVIARNRG